MIAALALLIAVQCPDGAPPPCSRAPAGPSARSVAVLNFRLLSRDSTDAYLAEGLADAVTSRLSQVERLDVASRTAARLGRAPRAAFVVSGTMLRQNQRLIVNVELLRASTGRNAWAQRYERPDTAVLSLERDIAVAVTSAMLPNVTAAERGVLGAGATRNAEAYDRLLRGDFFLARRSLSNTARAIEQYEAAVRIEPSLAAAHARIALASAIWMDWEWDPALRPPPESVLSKGIAAAERAVTLDSMDSDAWMARAYITVFARPRDFEGVEPAFRRAIALNPRNAEALHQYADWLGIVARHDEGVPQRRAALAIDPARAVTLRALGEGIGGPEGLALLDSALHLDPDQSFAYSTRGRVRLRLGDTAGARADIIEAERRAAPESRAWSAANAGNDLLEMGDTAGARSALDRARAGMAPTGALGTRALSVARLLFLLGRIEEAFVVVERVQPHGAALWFAIMDQRTDASTFPERLRRVLADARPPWVR